MMKYLFVFMAVIALTMASCTKDCYNCKVSTIEQEQVCREDFESQKEFDKELKLLKTLGYECL